MHRIFKIELIDKILVFLIVVATCLKVFIGIDCDETYMVVLGARLIQGEHLFKEIWDLYQTGVLPIYFLMKLYMYVTGSLIGVIVYLRIASVLAQFSVAYLFYRVFKEYKNALYASMIIALISPRYIQNFDYGFCGFSGIILCIIIVFYIVNNIGSLKKLNLIVLSIVVGLCFSESVLAYPTLIIVSAPLALYILLNIKNSNKSILLLVSIMITCFIAAGVYICYILKYTTLYEFSNNFFCGMMSDESHNGSNLFINLIRCLVAIRKDQLIVMVLIVVSSIFMMQLLNRINIDASLYFCSLFISSVAFILLNITGIRRSGPFGMNIRYLVSFLFSIPAWEKCNDKNLIWLFGYTGIFVFVSALLATNLGIAETSSFLLICIIGTILLLGEINNRKEIDRQFVIIFILSLIITKGFTVRVSGTGPANVLEKRHKYQFGVLSGIYDYQENVSKNDSIKMSIDLMTTNDDVILFISKEPVYNLFGNYKFTSLSPIPTVSYSKRWISYYKDYSYSWPTKIIIDKEKYETFEDASNENQLIRYFIEYMEPKSLTETQYFFIFSINSKDIS